MTFTINVAQFVGKEDIAASGVEVDREGLRGSPNRDLSVPESVTVIF